MQNGLRSRGFNIGETESPVTPVFLHSEGGIPEVTRMVRDLRENMGVFCSIVVYPVVPKGQIMLRIIPTSAHTLDDVEYTLNAFTELAEKLKNRVYQKEEDQQPA
jgi:glycine C-acetyltransferase